MTPSGLARPLPEFKAGGSLSQAFDLPAPCLPFRLMPANPEQVDALVGVLACLLPTSGGASLTIPRQELRVATWREARLIVRSFSDSSWTIDLELSGPHGQKTMIPLHSGIVCVPTSAMSDVLTTMIGTIQHLVSACELECL
jgi:hypothetical protein